MSNRNYSDLIKLNTFEERFKYLQLNGKVGEETFGFDRYLNQFFYHHRDDWKKARRCAIIRDNGCDLGIEDRHIVGSIYVHHVEPVTIDDILQDRKWIIDPEFLICASFNTHQAIHYGDENLLIKDYIARTPNDTIPWR